MREVDHFQNNYIIIQFKITIFILLIFFTLDIQIMNRIEDPFEIVTTIN